jgi:hypothetical protein
VVDAEFGLLRTNFEEIAANAFEADVARGRIEQCSFHNVRGNSIDLAGSAVEIVDTGVTRVYGIGISASQGSTVTAENIHATGAHIPVVSRDFSLFQVDGMQIARAWTAGFAAYRDLFPSVPAKIRATGVVFQDQSIRALVQEGNSISVNERTTFPGDLDMETLRRIQGTFAAMSPLDYRFGSEIELVGYELATPQVRSGHPLTVTLYWSALAQPGRDYTVFTHVLDSAGQVAVGWDNMPCLDACPTTEWRPGRLVDDRHLIPLPADLPAGKYLIALGLYSLETGERLPVLGPEGQQMPNATVRLERGIQVTDE